MTRTSESVLQVERSTTGWPKKVSMNQALGYYSLVLDIYA